MNVLIFNHLMAYSGNAIVVQVQFSPRAGAPFEVDAIIDTGAWISLFDKALAPLLGITNITAGQRVPVTPASGNGQDGYAFHQDVAVLGRRFNVPLVFVPAWPDGIPNLLGMRGFLEQFGQIAVEHSSKTFFHM